MAARAQDAKYGLHFWIGEILDVHRGRCRKVKNLLVNWYGNRSEKDIYISAYNPLTLTVKGSTENLVGITDTDSVLILFTRLTKSKYLPSEVANHVRQLK